MTVNEKIAKIRERMTENHIDAVIVPSADPHMSEYYSEHWKTRAWLSGFTGSDVYKRQAQSPRRRAPRSPRETHPLPRRASPEESDSGSFQ